MDQKNELAHDMVPELAIEQLVAGGLGLARFEGRIWLVRGAFPGDVVRARAARRHHRWVRGEVVEVVRPAPARRDPPCPWQSRCGGCPWMPLDEAAQRRWKRSILHESVTRIAGLPAPPVADTVAVPPVLGYRQRVEPVALRDGSSVRFGFHPPGEPQRVVDVEACSIFAPAGQPLWHALRDWFTAGPGAGEPALRAGGLRFVLRVSSAGQSIAAVGSPGLSLNRGDELARYLRARVAGLVGVVHFDSAGPRGRQRRHVVWGRGDVQEVWQGIRFRLPALSFAQVHAAAAERLSEEVVRLLDPAPGETALDLYGGVGLFAWALAQRGVRVEVCEADQAAVSAGARAAGRQGLPVRYVHARVEAYLARSKPEPVDLVVADPPRAGLGPAVAEAIASRRPRAIALVSCDPATFARDCARLERLGYALREAVPLDLFPQTFHVEAVGLLARVAPRPGAREDGR